jgi:hypothetical protein
MLEPINITAPKLWQVMDTRFSGRRARMRHTIEDSSSELFFLHSDVERPSERLGGMGGFKATVFFVALKPSFPPSHANQSSLPCRGYL